MVRTVAVDMEAPGIDLNHLSREFSIVVDRIQSVLRAESARCMDELSTDEVEIAERVVDARARDLRSGQGDRNDWVVALDAYEEAWMQAIRGGVGAASLAA